MIAWILPECTYICVVALKYVSKEAKKLTKLNENRNLLKSGRFARLLSVVNVHYLPLKLVIAKQIEYVDLRIPHAPESVSGIMHEKASAKCKQIEKNISIVLIQHRKRNRDN